MGRDRRLQNMESINRCHYHVDRQSRAQPRRAKRYRRPGAQLLRQARQSTLPKPSKPLEARWTFSPLPAHITICAKKNCSRGQTPPGKKWDGRRSHFSNVICVSNTAKRWSLCLRASGCAENALMIGKRFNNRRSGRSKRFMSGCALCPSLRNSPIVPELCTFISKIS